MNAVSISAGISDNGTYSLLGVPPGKAYVYVEQSRFVGNPYRTPSATVTVVSSKETPQDFTLAD